MKNGIKNIIGIWLCLCVLLCTMCGCKITDAVNMISGEKVLDDEIIINPYSRIGFDNLDETEQQMYRETASLIYEYGSERRLSCGTKEQLDKVFFAVMTDHPEFFYLNGYAVREYGGSITVSPVYTITKAQYEERLGQIEIALETALMNAPQNADDYQKAKYAFEYVVKYTDYVSDAPESQNIYSVFVNRRSVCAGYAKAVQLLLNKMGVECTYVTGTDKAAGSTHAWNIAKLDGEYYHIDATYGDAITQNGGSVDIFYDFLAFDDEFAQITRTEDTKLEMPEARGFKDNYYVREGCYIESYSPDALTELFLTAAQNCEDAVWLRFADEQTFDDAIYGIIYQHDLTPVLRECKRVNPSINTEQIAYYQDDKQYTLVIVL